MDTYDTVNRLRKIADSERTIVSMYVKYFTKSGNEHVETFTDFNKFVQFKNHVKSDPDVVSFQASFSEKRLKDDIPA